MIKAVFRNLLALIRTRSQRAGEHVAHAPLADTEMHPTTPLSIFVA